MENAFSFGQKVYHVFNMYMLLIDYPILGRFVKNNFSSGDIHETRLDRRNDSTTTKNHE